MDYQKHLGICRKATPGAWYIDLMFTDSAIIKGDGALAITVCHTFGEDQIADDAESNAFTRNNIESYITESMYVLYNLYFFTFRCTSNRNFRHTSNRNFRHTSNCNFRHTSNCNFRYIISHPKVSYFIPVRYRFWRQKTTIRIQIRGVFFFYCSWI